MGLWVYVYDIGDNLAILRRNTCYQQLSRKHRISGLPTLHADLWHEIETRRDRLVKLEVGTSLSRRTSVRSSPRDLATRLQHHTETREPFPSPDTPPVDHPARRRHPPSAQRGDPVAWVPVPGLGIYVHRGSPNDLLVGLQ